MPLSLRLIASFVLLMLSQAAAVRAQEQQLPLTRAIDVRSLPVERSTAGVPVQLRATVGFIEAPGTVFVQDESGGTFFRTKSRVETLRIGDVVDIKGVTVPGLYLTGIDATEFQVSGHGVEPTPQPATYEDLATGRFHYQKVVVEGIGRKLGSLEENRSLLHLALGGRVIEVRIDAPPTALQVVDSGLRITGLAAGGINDRRQLVFPYLRVSDWRDVTVAKPAAQLEKLPVTPAAQLLRFGSLEEAAHRVRVRGVVLANLPEGRLFVRDASPPPLVAGSIMPQPVALAVRLSASAALAIGEHVEVAGFPSMEGFSASLADAMVLRKLPERAAVSAAPAAVTAKALLSGAFDADLVTLTATLKEILRLANGLELRLISDETPLTAILASVSPAEQWLPGSKVQVTGICQIESASDKGFRSRPDRVRLLLRGIDDLQVLQAPAWWTSRRLGIASSVLLAAMLLAAIWISALRRQVAKQERVLRERVAFEAALEERQRLAREFHDTLEQELAGLSIRLDAAATRPLEDKARGLLEGSRHLVSRIQSEARNLVADLRSAPDTADADLPHSLQLLIDRLPVSESLAVSLEVEGALSPLAAHVVHHLRMMAQEAVTNAIKHGKPRTIALKIAAEPKLLLLTITDDGHGFDPQADTMGKTGHFGCVGIRERCRRIGATAEWQSSPGAGTRVQIQLPI